MFQKKVAKRGLQAKNCVCRGKANEKDKKHLKKSENPKRLPKMFQKQSPDSLNWSISGSFLRPFWEMWGTFWGTFRDISPWEEGGGSGFFKIPKKNMPPATEMSP